MHPILLTLGPLTLYSYGVAMVVAFVTATWLAGRALAQPTSQPAACSAGALIDFLSLSLLGGILGGRLLYVLLEWRYFAASPAEVVALWHGGLVWYGGLLGGVAAGWLYTRAKRLAFLRIVDHVIPFVALGHAIGRIGCVLNGCCYGKPTASWCGIALPGHPVRVFPTQLIEAAGLVAVFVLLRALQRPSIRRHPGRLFGVYLVAYGVLRYVVEFLRGDQAPWWGGWTIAQVISVGLVLAGLMLGWRRRLSDATTTSRSRL